MIKRELKINFKSFIIWLAILIGLFAIVFLLYPAIIQNDNFKRMDELMSIFPEEVLTAFNMDLSSLESVFGWLKSEGFVFILLIRQQSYEHIIKPPLRNCYDFVTIYFMFSGDF